MKIFLDGEFIDERHALVSALGDGLLFGEGVFETLGVRSGQALRSDAHLRRFRRSAEFLGLELGLGALELTAVTREAILRNDLEDGALRLTLVAGTPRRPHLIVHPSPGDIYAAVRGSGAAVVFSRYRVDEASPLCGHKLTSCVLHRLARREAESAGANESLLCNTSGAIAEGARSNVFAVRGGAVLTPALEEGGLPGITRAAAIQIMRAEGLSVSEGVLRQGDLALTDELFLTSARMRALSVVRLDGRTVGTGLPGPVARRLGETL